MKTLKAQNVFVVLSLFIGLLFVFLNPPFQTPDEAQHMFKMWGFTQKTLHFKVFKNHTGDILPLSLIETSRFERLGGNPENKTSVREITHALTKKLDKNNTAFYTFTPTAYTPVSYFPSFLVLWAMKLLNAPPLVMMYVLRLCSLFLYTALGYFAIKTMPVKKWLLASCALLPMAMYEASSVTTDALTVGAAFLFIAYTVKLSLCEKITPKKLAVFAGLVTLVSVCKYAYLPLILLYFIIPKEKFSSQKLRWSAFALILSLNLLITGVFLTNVMNSAKGVVSGAAGYEHGFMIAFILHKFGWFLGFIYKTLLVKLPAYFSSYIGLLGTNDTKLPLFVINSFAVLLLGAALIKTQKKEPVFDLKSKLIFACAFLASFFIIMCSSFILFQCYPVICGVQGRYFIPIMPLIFFLFDNKKIRWEFLPWIVTIYVPVMSLFAVWALVSRYFL